jgi:hypothetical protein
VLVVPPAVRLLRVRPLALVVVELELGLGHRLLELLGLVLAPVCRLLRTRS